MIHLVDMLVIEKDEDDEVYDLDLVKRTADGVIELVPGAGWLAIRIEDGCLSFIVVEFHSGPSTRDGVVVDGIKVERVFDGYGYHEVLRELRHTHWGESGYIYYPNGKIITAAFEALREWFDCD